MNRNEEKPTIAVLSIALSLALCSPARATVFWDDDFESGITPAPAFDLTGATGWYDYGSSSLNNDLSNQNANQINWTADRGRTGTHSVKLIYPNDNSGGGPFIDRFRPKDKQLNVRFSFYLVPGFQVSTVNNLAKMPYLRCETCPENIDGAFLLFGSVNPDGTSNVDTPFGFGFGLQNAVDQPDTGSLYFNVSINTDQWYDVQLQWIMNDIGLANGSMTAWVNGAQVFFQNGRQYRNLPDTMEDAIRIFRQAGSGVAYFDRIAMGNSYIPDIGGGQTMSPAAPRGLKLL